MYRRLGTRTHEHGIITAVISPLLFISITYGESSVAILDFRPLVRRRADPHLKGGQNASLYGSKRSNSVFTTA
jgi:hypothetical protein